MKLVHRLRKLESALPPCAGRVSRVVIGEYVTTGTDRCRRCGGCHVLVIKKVIVCVTPRAGGAGGSTPG